MRPEQNEKFDKKVYKKRAQDLELKKKYLPSLFKKYEISLFIVKLPVSSTNMCCSILSEDNVETEESTQKIKKKKKKRKRKHSESTSGNSNLEIPETKKMKVDKNSVNDNIPKTKKMKVNKNSVNDNIPKTKKMKVDKNSVNDNTTLSDERLKAYGLNPKKYKNKVKYGQFGH